MTTTHSIESHERKGAGALAASEWLCLAAAPTFAIMALLTSFAAAGAPDMLCTAMQRASPINGMSWMYVLMCAFHSAPWLKLVAGRRSDGRR